VIGQGVNRLSEYGRQHGIHNETHRSDCVSKTHLKHAAAAKSYPQISQIDADSIYPRVSAVQKVQFFVAREDFFRL
jgi:hypothetical protein